MNRVFFVCPKCKGKVYSFISLESDGSKCWKFKCKCKCGNEFYNNYRLAHDPNEIAKKILDPKNLAKLARETMKEMTDDDVEKYRIK